MTAAKSGDAQPQAERPPYEQARDELAELVKRLEAGGLTLEQSLALWERGQDRYRNLCAGQWIGREQSVPHRPV